VHKVSFLSILHYHFYPRDVVSAVYAIYGDVAGWLAVSHCSRYCV